MKGLLKKPAVQNDHIKPLYLKVKLGEIELNRVLIDNDAAINVLLLSTLFLLGKKPSDLVPTSAMVCGFTDRQLRPKGSYF